MGKNKKIIIILSSIISLVFICLAMIYFVVPIIYENKCIKRIYQDIEDNLSEKILLSCVSFVMVEEDTTNNVKKYSVGNSGVIVKKENNKYFIATANHILKNNITLRVYPYDSLTYKEYRDTMGATSLSDYYNSFPIIKIEKQNFNDDLAIVSFESTKEYSISSISKDDIKRNSRIITIGNPDGGLFKSSYGKILDESEYNITFSDNGTTNCIKHNCYINHGSSGSPVFDENFKLIGINIGASTSFAGKFRYGYMIKATKINEILQ